MPGFSNVTQMGHLGRDAEVRETNAGRVVSGTLATGKKVRGQERTTWVRFSWWIKDNQEWILPLLTKGALVLINGELSGRDVEDKTTGRKRHELEVTVFNMVPMPSGKGIKSTTSGTFPAPSQPAEVDSSDIPF